MLWHPQTTAFHPTIYYPVPGSLPCVFPGLPTVRLLCCMSFWPFSSLACPVAVSNSCIGPFCRQPAPLSAYFAHLNLQWPNMESRIALKVVLQVFKCLHGRAPSYLSELLHVVSSQPARSRLRSASHNALIVPKFNLRTSSRKAFSACAPRLWNKLPSSLASESSLPAFKTVAKDFLSSLH